MAGETIKYSDLITPDDSLEKLTKQLDDIASALQLVQKSAVSLNDSMKTMSGATSEGRSAIAEASKEAEKLAKAQYDLAQSETETAKEIARLKDLQHLQNLENKEAAKQARSAAGSYNDLSVKYSQLKRLMNEMNPTTKKGREEFKQMQKEAKRLHDEMNRLQQATGNFSLNVGNYTSALKDLPGPMGAVANGIGGIISKAKALIATPLGVALTAVTGAFMALKTALNATEEGQRKLAKVTGFLKGALNGIVETVVQAGEVLVDVFTGNWKKLGDDLSDVKKAFLNIGDVAKESANIAEAEKQLEQARNKFIVEKSRLELERAKYERISKDSTKTAKERQNALQSMLDKDEEIYKAERKFLQEQINLLARKQKLTSNNTEDNKEMYELQAELNNLEAEHIRKQIASDKVNARIVNQQKKDIKELSAEEKKKYEEEIKMMKASAEAQVKFSTEQYDATIKIYEKERDFAIKNGASIADAWNEFVDKQQKLDDQYAEHTDKLEKERAKKRAETVKKIIEAENTLRNYYTQNTLTEKELKNQSIFNAILDEEQEAIDALELVYKAGTEEYENELKKIEDIRNKKFKKAEKEIKEENNGILTLLGFSFETEKEMQDAEKAINDAYSIAVSNVNSLIDSYVALKQQALDTATARVDSAQKALDAEIEARNAGYANNVENAQKELQLAKQTQAKAQAEARKAEQAQQRLDTLQQSTSLITASANLWKSFSGAGPAGVALALGAIATMWGSFAAAKIKAGQVTKEKYGEGTVELLQGGSHQSGNDIDLGTKADGTQRRAEGGEFFAVINKRNSRKYRRVIPDVIRSINNDTFASKYLTASARMNGLLVNIDSNKTTDIRMLQSDVKTIKERMGERTYIDQRGYLVESKQGYKRIIRR